MNTIPLPHNKQTKSIPEIENFQNINSLHFFGQQQGVYDQINQNFQEQNEKQKTIQETRDILGDAAKELTDDQVYDLVNEVQYLVDTWIEEYEQKVFDGKTLKELLQLNL